ncbi:MAG: aminoacyl-tRNA hydrolase [Spirochaetaceae bacterium]|jgi:PTH1 family peptidyl-tRNA hydrolase|nr:aminoacyl-tRNA hydrolase [Spirochaetaceae bacterium]
MIALAAFLGNPGPPYARTRHNAGRLLAASLEEALAPRWQRKHKGMYASIAGAALYELLRSRPGAAQMIEREAPPAGARLAFHFLMPETFMNLSGASIAKAASFFAVPPEAVLVVHDELELPLGAVSLKFSGGLGGHNGLRSAKAALDTAGFWRLRIGIGRPAHTDIARWVLEAFEKDEELPLAQALAGAGAVLARALLWGPETLLPEWGKKNCLNLP